MANKIEQSFYSIYSYFGIESIECALIWPAGFNIPQYVIWAKVEVGTPFPGPTVKHIKLVSCTSIVLYYTFLSTCASWITG